LFKIVAEILIKEEPNVEYGPQNLDLISSKPHLPHN